MYIMFYNNAVYNSVVSIYLNGKELEHFIIDLGWKYPSKTKRTLLTRTGPGISPEDIIETVMQTM
jgi:hypothetical protein